MAANASARTVLAVAVACLILVAACSFGAGSSCLVDYDAFAPVNAASIWFEHYWQPCVQCCKDYRIGRRGRGGKWLCFDAPINGTTAISVGVDADYSFEQSLLAFGVARIDVYDTAPPALMPNISVKVQVHMRTIKQTMLMVALRRATAQGHRMSVLKLDCDGCEHEIFSRSVLNTLHKQNAMIVITMHYPYNKGWLPRVFGRQQALTEAATKMARLWALFVNTRFYPYHKEHQRTGTVEYSFLPR